MVVDRPIVFHKELSSFDSGFLLVAGINKYVLTNQISSYHLTLLVRQYDLTMVTNETLSIAIIYFVIPIMRLELRNEISFFFILYYQYQV